MDLFKKNKQKKAVNNQLKSSLDFTKTPVDRFAIGIAEVFGSIKFLLFCILFFLAWAGWNLGLFYTAKPFDSFPFPILEMLVSLFAIILSVSVLINQNRQGRVDKVKQQVEFEVNVRAEEEVTKMLSMLHEIHQHLGLNSCEDKELEKMKEMTDIEEIHKTLDDTE